MKRWHQTARAIQWMGLAALTAGAASASTPAAQPTSKMYHFRMESTQSNAPVRECWVQGEHSRLEIKMKGRTRTVWSDGKALVEYVSGQPSAKTYPADPTISAFGSPWLSMYQADMGAFLKLDPKKVGAVTCEGRSFSVKQGQGKVKVTEWTDPATGFVFQRGYELPDGQVISNEMKGMEELPSVGGDFFRVPSGVTVKSPPVVGKAAPGFTLKRYDTGEAVSLGDFKGKKVVLVNLFATWCGPCVSETPGFVKVYEAYKEKGVEFISIDVGERGKDPKALVEQFAKKHGVTWPIVMDDATRVSEAYDASGIPTNVIIDQAGIVRFYRQGGIPETALKQELDRLVAGGAKPGKIPGGPEE